MTAKRILITGASGGIGRALAICLAESGTDLIIHGRNRTALDELTGDIKARGGNARTAIADIGTFEGVASLVGQIGAGPIDVIIHAAGVAHVDRIENIKAEDWHKSLNINVTAPFMITQQLLPMMHEGGSIVFILSVAARTAFADWAAYCASKFALEGFTRVLREELRPRKIRVINVYPSATATEIWDKIPGAWSKENMLTPETVADAIKYALLQPSSTVIEDISLGNIGGNQ
jgi:short-subunit dehydrogenase